MQLSLFCPSQDESGVEEGAGRWARATEKGSVRSQTYNAGSEEPQAALAVGDRRARSL